MFKNWLEVRKYISFWLSCKPTLSLDQTPWWEHAIRFVSQANPDVAMLGEYSFVSRIITKKKDGMERNLKMLASLSTKQQPQQPSILREIDNSFGPLVFYCNQDSKLSVHIDKTSTVIVVITFWILINIE